jgi:hypothetical protein
MSKQIPKFRSLNSEPEKSVGLHIEERWWWRWWWWWRHDYDDDDKYILRYWNNISYSMRIFRQVGTSSADQIPFWEVDSHWSCQKVSISTKHQPKELYNIQKRLLLDSTLSQLNPVHSLTP